jgi:glycosyltransferase involved in cell wall biosynthesis
MFSVVIPVYRNQETIPALLEALHRVKNGLDGDFEAVLVVDGSPDHSLDLLGRFLPQARFSSQLIVLSRNFGSFSAIRAGLGAARGELIAVMAADLQEPPELMLEFQKLLLSGDVDVVVGTRAGRGDPLLGRLASGLFWGFFRTFVQREVPAGGVDVFACTREFAGHILRLNESNSTLVGLIFWLGFRRGEVAYTRRPRFAGRSSWSFARRVRYLLDSTFAFSDLPIRLLTLVGLGGVTLAVGLVLAVLVARLSGGVPVPGYAATAVMVLFFGGLNSLGLGLLGEYIWRTFENTKGRPGYLIARHMSFNSAEAKSAAQVDLENTDNHG